MPVFWTYDTLPELARLPKAERDALWQRSAARALRRWQVWAAAAVLGLVMCGVQLAFLRLATPVVGLVGAMLGMIVVGGLVGGALFGAAFRLVLLRYARPLIWEALGTHCPACGYDLTGNTSGTCPECGRPLPPRPPTAGG